MMKNVAEIFISANIQSLSIVNERIFFLNKCEKYEN